MAVLMMSEPKAERESYTLLGWYVRELMVRKRIKNQDDLAARITVAGYPISQPAVSKILRGKSEPSRKFIAALAVALDLHGDERRELADLFSYDEAATSEPISEESMQGMKEVRERVQEEELRGERQTGGVSDHRA